MTTTYIISGERIFRYPRTRKIPSDGYSRFTRLVLSNRTHHHRVFPGHIVGRLRFKCKDDFIAMFIKPLHDVHGLVGTRATVAHVTEYHWVTSLTGRVPHAHCFVNRCNKTLFKPAKRAERSRCFLFAFVRSGPGHRRDPPDAYRTCYTTDGPRLIANRYFFEPFRTAPWPPRVLAHATRTAPTGYPKTRADDVKRGIRGPRSLFRTSNVTATGVTWTFIGRTNNIITYLTKRVPRLKTLLHCLHIVLYKIIHFLTSC
jgi:hypothetical protein